MSALSPNPSPTFVPADSSPAESSSWWDGLSPAGRWGVGIGGSLAGLALVAGGVAAGMYVSWRNQNRIAPNVVVHGVAVGDMTLKEAKAELRKKYGNLRVRLEAPEKTYVQTLAQMGGHLKTDRALLDAYFVGRSASLPANALRVWKARSEPTRLGLKVAWDKKALRRRAALIAKQYRREPVDARLVFAGGVLAIAPHAEGRELNAGATLKALQASYKVGRDKAPLATRAVAPEVTSAELEGRNVLLGTYTTGFNSGTWGRTRNIHVASERVDGRILMPGERFSFNACTGERTWDKGYRMAHIYEDRGNGSEIVDGLAGGVCQVSTTLYNAVRKSNEALPSRVFLRVNERNFHSLPVPYARSGMDATVAWPSKDFQFTNTLAHPIFLRARVLGSRLRMEVWGRIPHGQEPAMGQDSRTQLAQVKRTTS